MSKYFSKFLLLPIALMAIMAFVLVTPVFADDGQPVDPPPASEVTLPPQDVDVPTEPVVPAEGSGAVVETPIADAAPTEVLPTEEIVVETAAPTEVPAETLAGPETPVDPAPVTEETSLADAVTALAESDIQLVAPSGEPVSMASTSSSNVVVTGDPYFTVGSVTYRFMKPGGCGILTNCFESTTPIQDALDYMADHSLTPTDRKLYIEADTYDEYVWVEGNLSGVNGLLGLVGLGDYPEDVQINGSIYIHNMLSGFSLTNLSVTNDIDQNDAAIWTWNNNGLLLFTDVNAQATGEDSTGIFIEHTGSVELNRVNASNNAYLGARINNSGSVKITNSSFDNNLVNTFDGIDFYDDQYDEFGNYTGTSPFYAGLYIDATGPVTLNGVSAQGNIGDGVDIEAWNSLVTIKNSVFDNNDEGSVVDAWGDGLWIDGNIVTLENIQANKNDLRGIFSYANTSFAGLHLHTDNNGWDGVAVETCFDFGDSDDFCDNTGAGTVSIKTSSSIGNGEDGFDVYAKGLITITDAYTNGNGGSGYLLDNGSASLPAAMNLTSISAYSNDCGIELYSRGVINLSIFTANDNGSYGLYIDAIGINNNGIGAVTITNLTGFNETGSNGTGGYVILSHGAITITNLDTHDNGGLGGIINNFGAATAAPVTVNTLGPSDWYSGYWNNMGGGLQITTRGTVTIARIVVENNQGVGAFINNVPAGILAGMPVTVSDSNFNNNMVSDGDYDEHGLVVYSKGLITLMNIEAIGNDGNGVYLNNQTSGATAGVTINAGLNKGNTFMGNYGDGVDYGSGLVILSNGVVNLTNIFANSNGNALGVIIDNTTGTAGVTIKQVGTWCGNNYCTEGNSFSWNGFDGLFILSNGPVTVTFFEARNNGGSGIYVDASGGIGAVTINGSGNYDANASENGYGGIDVSARGNIILTKIDARWNMDHGAVLDNEPGVGSVTLTDAKFDGNGWIGLEITSTGAVTWKNGSANDNFMFGASIENQNTLIGKPVSLTNVFTSGNGETGLSIVSKGIVTLTDVESNSNSANDYSLEYGQRWQDNITNEQYWSFDGESGDSVTIEVNSGNFNPWIFIDDPDGNTIAKIDGVEGTLSYTLDLIDGGRYSIYVGSYQEWNNGSYEISIYEGLTPPASWIEMESDANGIFVDNRTGLNAGVTILNNGYNRWNSNNSGTDVVVLSSGTVALTRMDLTDSRMGGLYVNNTMPTTAPGVTLTNINFNNNDQIAAEIYTKGAVVVKTADVGGNGSYGYYIKNDSATVPSAITFTDVHVYGYGSSDSGIYLRSKGAVTLTNVSSNENGGSGFDIQTLGAISLTNVETRRNNDFGALLVNDPGTGTVTLTNANFDENNYGLRVISTGAVTWKNGSANNNRSNGAVIVNTNTLLGKPVSITNVSTMRNYETGLSIVSKGIVTLTDVESNNNSANYSTINYGEQWLDNLNDDQAWLFDGTADDHVTIQVASDNFNPWIYVTDPDGNFIEYADGFEGSLSLTIDLPTSGWYMIHVGTDQDKNIYGYELSIYEGLAAPGSWTELESNANGIYVDNSTGVNAGVTILNNLFSRWNGNNSGTDVEIYSNGAVALTRMDLNDSSHGGLFIDNSTSSTAPGVTLTSVNFYGNDQTAAEIYTKGAVIVKTADLGGNGGYGYYIENNSGAALSPITFTDVFVRGDGFGDTGIFLRSKGAVTLNKVWSGDSAGSGFDIQTLGAVTFNDVSATNNQDYGADVATIGTFTVNQPYGWYNTFVNNGLTGLYVEAGGNVTLTKVRASSNGWRDEFTGEPITDAYGIFILNSNALGTSPIVLTDIFTGGNTLDGTHIVTRGAVTVTTLEVRNNTFNGLYIDQSTAPNSLNPIILNKITAENNGSRDEFGDIINYGDGIYVNAKGAITLNKIGANNNSGSGANLLNNLAGSTGSVTILNTLGGNLAVGNGGSGVNIQSNGAVNVTGLETIYNGIDGLDVRNGYLGTNPLVTLNSIISRGNSQRGIYVDSNGVVTLNSSWSIGNGWDGIHVETDNNIFINNTTAIKNNWAGIYVVLSQPTNVLKLTNSTWFGNLRNPNPGDRNLMRLGGTQVIL